MSDGDDTGVFFSATSVSANVRGTRFLDSRSLHVQAAPSAGMWIPGLSSPTSPLSSPVYRYKDIQHQEREEIIQMGRHVHQKIPETQYEKQWKKAVSPTMVLLCIYAELFRV